MSKRKRSLAFLALILGVSLTLAGPLEASSDVTLIQVTEEDARTLSASVSNSLVEIRQFPNGDKVPVWPESEESLRAAKRLLDEKDAIAVEGKQTEPERNPAKESLDSLIDSAAVYEVDGSYLNLVEKGSHAVGKDGVNLFVARKNSERDSVPYCEAYAANLTSVEPAAETEVEAIHYGLLALRGTSSMYVACVSYKSVPDYALVIMGTSVKDAAVVLEVASDARLEH